MCERTFWGCPHCAEPADSEVRACELRTERIEYHLDAEGAIDHNTEPDYGEDFTHEDLGYYCRACHSEFAQLDPHAVDESCDCDECVEPEPDDPGPDPDRIVVLRRTVDSQLNLVKVFGEDIPAEFIQLWANRATIFQPLPRWRAAELYNQYLTDTVGCERTGLPIVIDFDFQMPDEAAYNLILPGFDPHKPDKGAPDGGHVAAGV